MSICYCVCDLSNNIFPKISHRRNGCYGWSTNYWLLFRKWGDSHLPPQHLMLVTNINFELPEHPIFTEVTDTNGLILPDEIINLRSFNVMDYPWEGNPCAQKSLMNWDIMSNCCSCIQMNNQVGNIYIMFDVRVNISNRYSFTTPKSTKWFIQQYTITGKFSSGIR